MSEQDEPPQKMYNRIVQWEDQSQKKKEKGTNLINEKKRNSTQINTRKKYSWRFFVKPRKNIFIQFKHTHIVTKYYTCRNTHTKKIQK